MFGIGFPVPKKENEKRRAITLESLRNISYPDKIFIESGYGEVLNIEDDDYLKAGANVVSREEVFEQKIICNPKSGSIKEFNMIKKKQIIFGWIHAVQGREITDFFINNELTGFAWEDMFCQNKHIFWENNSIAGEAALLHALSLWGRMDKGIKVALIGRGNVAQGVNRIAEKLGFDVDIYGRNMESLLKRNVGIYDVIVNAVLWDINRKDHLIYKEDLKKMKKGSLIVDVSCDDNMGIETSHATTFDEPVYYVDNILHYVVDHTPSMFYKTASRSISNAIVPYLNQLISGELSDILLSSKIISNGVIIDDRIRKFQKR
jgi:N5-(carboxyethyl)ornithine synthase